MAGKLGDKLKAGEARQIAQQLAKSLAAAQTPLDLVGILQEFAGHLDNSEVLGEVMANAKSVSALLEKGQELGKLFNQAEAFGDPIKQMQALGKMPKSPS